MVQDTSSEKQWGDEYIKRSVSVKGPRLLNTSFQQALNCLLEASQQIPQNNSLPAGSWYIR